MTHPSIRRALSILTACSLLAAPAALLTGCGSSNSDSAASQQTTASNAPSREAALNPYLEATNDYNHNIVTFDFSIAPSLDSLRKGEHKEYISLPNFENLKTALEAARSDPKVAGVYPDIDAAADDLLAILKDLEPLATKLKSYYSAKTMRSRTKWSHSSSRSMTNSTLPTTNSTPSSPTATRNSASPRSMLCPSAGSTAVTS